MIYFKNIHEFIEFVGGNKRIGYDFDKWNRSSYQIYEFKYCNDNYRIEKRKKYTIRKNDIIEHYMNKQNYFEIVECGCWERIEKHLLNITPVIFRKRKIRMLLEK
jgi:hypothetical protein